jgi:hypothetical protein
MMTKIWEGKPEMNTKSLELHRSSLGDVAIDGLLKGILAGIVMLLYLLVSGFFRGDDPLLALARFSPIENATPFLGLLVHLGVSAIYGALFGLLCWFFIIRRQMNTGRWTLVLAGLAYGLLLWLIAQVLLLPGSGSGLAQFGAGNLAVGHLIYGAVLGSLLRFD